MNQFWGVGSVRDYWARYTPPVIHNLAWLNNPDCFRPKMIAAPLVAGANIAANAYVLQNFALIPGSWVVAISQVNGDALELALTDLSTNYSLQTAPLLGAMFANNGAARQPFYLPEPYMMAGSALLRVEIWNNTAVATVGSQIVIHYLEPKEV